MSFSSMNEWQQNLHKRITTKTDDPLTNGKCQKGTPIRRNIVLFIEEHFNDLLH